MSERESDNANTEGEFEGTVSFGQSQPFGAEQTTNPFGKGSTGTARGNERLFTDPGSDVGGGDFGDGTTETPKRKRGRPKGSTNAKPGGIAKLTGDKLAAARNKLRDTLAGVVGFGVAYYGGVRANHYKKISPELAQRVWQCYQIPAEEAAKVGEPLADTFITWFPQHVETTTRAIDPGLAVARLFTIFQRAHELEKDAVTFWSHRQAMGGFEPPKNGKHPEPDLGNVEQGAAQWQESQSPQPEEINPEYAATQP